MYKHNTKTINSFIREFDEKTDKTFSFEESNSYRVEACGSNVTVFYTKKAEIYRGIFDFFNTYRGQDFKLELNAAMENIGVMIDCSRNAVVNIVSLKKLIKKLAAMGYNRMMLYTEDTYEIDGEPYFGYMRGRYTKAEIQDLDSYAAEYGVEIIPCVQTLAHLNAIFRWKNYYEICDCGDILLVGNDATYTFIDNMFRSLREMYSSNYINIGMDEAHLLGSGKFSKENGVQGKFDIMCAHLKKILEIADKYGFKCLMWSDMFLNHPGECELLNEVELIYWDYFKTKKEEFSSGIAKHYRLGKNISFAGGAITWAGFAPHNKFSINSLSQALLSCKENNVKNMYVTMWGDDSCECSAFSVLPTLYHTAQKNYGLEGSFKEGFKKLFDCEYDDFLLADLPDEVLSKNGEVINSAKILFYNDYFIGLMDSLLTGGESAKYQQIAKQLGRVSKNKEWGFIFKTLEALSRVLSLKVDLGVLTRQAYLKDDKEGILELIKNRYKPLLKELDNFLKACEKQWYTINKSFGFEVQTVRIGGLIKRTEHCIERLEDYANGKIKGIEELDEKQLDIRQMAKYGGDITLFNSFSEIFTANIVSW